MRLAPSLPFTAPRNSVVGGADGESAGAKLSGEGFGAVEARAAGEVS